MVTGAMPYPHNSEVKAATPEATPKALWYLSLHEPKSFIVVIIIILIFVCCHHYYHAGQTIEDSSSTVDNEQYCCAGQTIND